MQLNKEQLSPTRIKLTIVAEPPELAATKQTVLARLSQNVKVPGFRPGKAPDNLVEKHIDQRVLESEILDQAINQLYVGAIEQEQLRPAASPQVSVTKFVPYSTLEFTAEVEVVGDVKLPDYTKIRLAPEEVEVTAKEVNNVVKNLLQRAASKKEVSRPAKSGDEVTIDFKGLDAKTGEPIPGADGQDYSLVLGSNSFIPGFEEELAGIKSGSDKTFNITFPKDYGSKDLQNREVTFSVTAKKIQQLTEPKADDAFAATIGSFKTLTELKADIKKQLSAEKQQEANRSYDNKLLETIAAKSVVAVPKSLVDEEIKRIEEEEKRSTAYRGQTWQEHLDAEGITADEHREKQRPSAELRVKAGLILGEISAKEHISVTPQELEMRIQLLKGQYTDPAMQAELDKPENRRDIHSRLLTEKTLDVLRTFSHK